MLNKIFFAQNINRVNTRDGLGYLYNYYAVSDANFAPTGWHVPTRTEWETMISYLGGNSVTGGKLKETGTTYWQSPNTGATNSTGFTGRGGGARTGDDGDFIFTNVYGQFWNITSSSNAYDYARLLYYYNAEMDYGSPFSGATVTEVKKGGRSVRLIKDDSTWYDGMLVRDYDKNYYETVKIGNQVWTKANYMCTHLNDGTEIPRVIPPFSWVELAVPAWCQYGDSQFDLGYLYNWYAVDAIAGLAPSGWHVPSRAEWVILDNYTKGSYGSGLYLKEKGFYNWAYNDAIWVGQDTYNFTAKGAGIRDGTGFDDIGYWTGFWNSDVYDSVYSYGCKMAYDLQYTLLNIDLKYYGFSVRLIKDDSTDTGTMTDQDGNIYRTVKIGDQVWMASNLKTTHYTSGGSIANVTNQTTWNALTTGALCAYNNDESYV